MFLVDFKGFFVISVVEVECSLWCSKWFLGVSGGLQVFKVVPKVFWVIYRVF